MITNRNPSFNYIQVVFIQLNTEYWRNYQEFLLAAFALLTWISNITNVIFRYNKHFLCHSKTEIQEKVVNCHALISMDLSTNQR